MNDEEKALEERRAYMRDYMRRYRHGLRLKRSSLNFPIHAPKHDIGLGATIARSFRESA